MIELRSFLNYRVIDKVGINMLSKFCLVFSFFIQM